LIGVEDERVPRALEIIRECCSEPEDAKQKRATIFVLNISEFIQL